jgi:hypothetical protein
MVFKQGTNIKIKAPLHSLLGGFQPKPYHNVGGDHLHQHKRNFLLPGYETIKK